MTTSNDSSVVLRLPQDLKKRLQEQAEQQDMSLSEVIRMKLMIAESAVHREPVIRLGQEQYRLWDVLRPDVLSYDLVSSEEAPHAEAVFIEEPGAKKLPLCGTVSDVLDRAIGGSRDAAMRLGSTAVAPVHLAIAMLGIEDANATRAMDYLCGGHRHVLRKLESEAGAFPSQQRTGRNGALPLTKSAEKVLKVVELEAKLHRLEVADTTMLLLSLLRDAERLVPAFVALGITYTTVDALLERQ